MDGKQQRCLSVVLVTTAARRTGAGLDTGQHAGDRKSVFP